MIFKKDNSFYNFFRHIQMAQQTKIRQLKGNIDCYMCVSFCIGELGAALAPIIFSIKVDYLNNSNRTHSMHLGDISYEHQIDRLLKIQYHDICFNPAKRQALQRLTSPPHMHLSQRSPINFGQDGLKNASLLHNYIRQVYERYGIEDPIRKQLRLAGKHTHKSTPEKGPNAASLIQSDRLTRTKKKLLNMKESFKRDSEEVIYSQLTNNQPYIEGQSSINTTRVNREIGYRTKQKIRFKTITSQEGQRSPPVLREFTLTNNQPEHSSGKAWKGQSRSYTKQRPRQLAERIGYCPMCQEIVLQENMTYHQSQCQQWLSAQDMSKEKVDILIANKIMRMQQEIYAELQRKDQQNIAAEYGDIKTSIKLWMQGGRNSFDQIKAKFQQFSLNLLEKVGKLNWFRGFQGQLQSSNKVRM